MTETKKDIQVQGDQASGEGSVESHPEYPIMVRVAGAIMSLSCIFLGYAWFKSDSDLSNARTWALANLIILFVYSLLLVGKVPLPIGGHSRWNVCKFCYSSTAWLSVCMGLGVPIGALVNLLTPEDPMPVAFGLGLIAGGIAVLIAGVGLFISEPKYLAWQDGQQEAFND